MEIYKKLPISIVNIILEYTGIIKNRNGKYMNQIIDDGKYNIIKNIIILKCTTIENMALINNTFYSDLFFCKNSIGIIYDYKFWGNTFYIYIYKDKSHAFFYGLKWWIYQNVFSIFNLDKKDENTYSWDFRDVYELMFNNYYYDIVKYKYK